MPGSRRAPLIILALAALSLGGIIAMAAAGVYAFVWKSAVVPLLIVGAFASARFGSFVSDWAVFLGVVTLFDGLRGLIYSAITSYQLPVYMGYAIEAERRLTGRVLPVAVQAQLLPAGAIDWVGRVCVVLHASHFLYFLLFALVVWTLRPERFSRLRAAFVLLMFAGLAIYLAVPTVPPWMAAERFGVLPPIDHVVERVYNASIPTLRKTFDTNPIAAMPSLHAAFPALCGFAALRVFGRWGWLAIAYALGVTFSIIYLGEHYLVDALIGWALAWAACAIGFAEGGPAERSAFAWHRMRPVRALLVLALVLLAGEAVGRTKLALERPFVPDARFIARELGAHWQAMSYFAAERAMADGQLQDAATRARATLDEPLAVRFHADARVLLGMALMRQARYEEAEPYLEGLDERHARADVLLAQGICRVHRGRARDGFASFLRSFDRDAEQPEAIYWAARTGRELGLLAPDAVAQLVEHLREIGTSDAVRWADELAQGRP